MSSSSRKNICLNLMCFGGVRMVKEGKKGHFLAVTPLHFKKGHFLNSFESELTQIMSDFFIPLYCLFYLLSLIVYGLGIDLKMAIQR